MRRFHHGMVLAVVVLLSLVQGTPAEPVFVARTAMGKEVRGPLHAIHADWSIELGKGVRRRIAGADLISLRQVGQSLPPLPTDDHLILASGDRLPVRDLKLDDEKLTFRHPDLGGGAYSVPLSAVLVIWRSAPERTVSPERLRRELAGSNRTRDRILLRNGDAVTGTLERFDAVNVQIEVNRKAVPVRTPQVAAVGLSTELIDRTRPRGLHARLTLADGTRLTLTGATSDGTTIRGRTPWGGAQVSIPVERLVAVEMVGGKAVALADLAPVGYTYRPWLDETLPWKRDANALGGDLRVGGDVHARGIGMHGNSLLTWKLDGGYRRFEAVVGLDDLDGRRGRVRIVVRIDGKAMDLGKRDVLSREGGAVRLSLDVAMAKELTLEIAPLDQGPVQAVVNWVEARLVK